MSSNDGVQTASAVVADPVLCSSTGCLTCCLTGWLAASVDHQHCYSLADAASSFASIVAWQALTLPLLPQAVSLFAES